VLEVTEEGVVWLVCKVESTRQNTPPSAERVVALGQVEINVAATDFVNPSTNDTAKAT
jgi:hypothetical protein